MFAGRCSRKCFGECRQVDLAKASCPLSKVWENLRGGRKNLSCYRKNLSCHRKGRCHGRQSGCRDGKRGRRGWQGRGDDWQTSGGGCRQVGDSRWEVDLERGRRARGHGGLCHRQICRPRGQVSDACRQVEVRPPGLRFSGDCRQVEVEPFVLRFGFGRALRGRDRRSLRRTRRRGRQAFARGDCRPRRWSLRRREVGRDHRQVVFFEKPERRRKIRRQGRGGRRRSGYAHGRRGPDWDRARGRNADDGLRRDGW